MISLIEFELYTFSKALKTYSIIKDKFLVYDGKGFHCYNSACNGYHATLSNAEFCATQKRRLTYDKR